MKNTGSIKLIVIFAVLVVVVIAIGLIANAVTGSLFSRRIQPRQIMGKSMEPALKQGMFVATSQYDNPGQIRRGDIVVYATIKGVDYIHRVVGLPGDTVEIREGIVYLNGKQLAEPYLSPGTKTNAWRNGFITAGQPMLVPSGNYFILGDNRDHASDSREFGFVQETDIQAKYLFCYWHCK